MNELLAQAQAGVTETAALASGEVRLEKVTEAAVA